MRYEFEIPTAEIAEQYAFHGDVGELSTLLVGLIRRIESLPKDGDRLKDLVEDANLQRSASRLNDMLSGKSLADTIASSFLDGNTTIGAIKMVRMQTGMSLQDARGYVLQYFPERFSS